jgi:hypothetical protein
MAEPGLSELITTTLRLRQKKIRDNVSNHNAILMKMDEQGSIVEESGGRTIIEEMSYAENGTFKRYAGGEVLNISSIPVATAAEFNWKQFAVAVVLNGLEKRQNSGPEGVIKLLGMRMDVAEATLKNNLNADMISDGTADSSKQIGGLKLLVAKAPTNTVGGIDRSTSAGAFYKNYKFDTTVDTPALGTVDASNVKAYYDYVLNNIQRDSDGPKIIFAGKTHFYSVQQACQAIQRITDPKLAKLGYRNIEFCEMPVVLGKSVTFGSETLMQDDLSWFLDTKHIKLRIHKDAYFEPLETVQSINQDAVVSLLVFMGNMTASMLKTSAVLFDT